MAHLKTKKQMTTRGAILSGEHYAPVEEPSFIQRFASLAFSTVFGDDKTDTYLQDQRFPPEEEVVHMDLLERTCDKFIMVL